MATSEFMYNVTQGKLLTCTAVTFMNISDDGDSDIEITHEAAGNKGMKSGRLYKTKQEQVREGISLLISILIFIN